MKKKKLYMDKLYMGLYKANITFLIGDVEKLDKYLKKEYGMEEKKYPRGGQTTEFTHKNGSKGYILWLPKLDYAALAHEATHLAGYIFEWRRVYTTSFGTDEHFAYMVEWIARQYITFAKNKK